MNAVRAELAPGRWHFQHGPIDLVIGADGDERAVRTAIDSAWERFGEVLPELVSELRYLRAPVSGEFAPHASVAGRERLRGTVALRMWDACAPFALGTFVTPMAAVAGSVAEEIVDSFRRSGVRRAWVNNGGDIALHLAEGESLRVAVCNDPRERDTGEIARNSLRVDAADRVRGIATSGWRGRSQSFGIADAVTVTAATAACADVAATLVANAVDVEHPAIRRLPANAVRDDSDLGARPVTVACGARSPETGARSCRSSPTSSGSTSPKRPHAASTAARIAGASPSAPITRSIGPCWKCQRPGASSARAALIGPRPGGRRNRRARDWRDPRSRCGGAPPRARRPGARSRTCAC